MGRAEQYEALWLERNLPHLYALRNVNRDSGGELEQQALCDKIPLAQLVENAKLAAEIAANPPPGLAQNQPALPSMEGPERLAD